MKIELLIKKLCIQYFSTLFSIFLHLFENFVTVPDVEKMLLDVGKMMQYILYKRLVEISIQNLALFCFICVLLLKWAYLFYKCQLFIILLWQFSWRPNLSEKSTFEGEDKVNLMMVWFATSMVSSRVQSPLFHVVPPFHKHFI